MISPEQDAEFVASMEELLETYARPYDAQQPVVCMDEQPVQLVRETRPPLAATAEHPQRVADYEYEWAGTVAVFLFCEPLVGWREATARERRTKLDWALEVARLLEGRYANCAKITLVDNLNTHTKGAFYEAFEQARARELVRRIEFCYTPRHGSWLNIAECELSAMTRQSLDGRRIGDLAALRAEIAAWSADINTRQREVEWQMTVADARCKLKSVYPKIIL